MLFLPQRHKDALFYLILQLLLLKEKERSTLIICNIVPLLEERGLG
jgi:hypothetical protein